ncbi:hypothetical protein [secondary endosymbiont of Ctenarytaina eucalypti]|uniref:hypothetical protein n=1 Tax=secondary endosymbiont of Ctenarytaina eucalypti TaxID=1199245 RepID=UPI0003077C24|nr:hypothetical protein [secondary endosymbiont of Ctenarytaina eucalypti]
MMQQLEGALASINTTSLSGKNLYLKGCQEARPGFVEFTDYDAIRCSQVINRGNAHLYADSV